MISNFQIFFGILSKNKRYFIFAAIGFLLYTWISFWALSNATPKILEETSYSPVANFLQLCVVLANAISLGVLLTYLRYRNEVRDSPTGVFVFFVLFSSYSVYMLLFWGAYTSCIGLYGLYFGEESIHAYSVLITLVATVTQIYFIIRSFRGGF